MKRSIRFLALSAGILAAATAQAHGPKNFDVRAALAPVDPIAIDGAAARLVSVASYDEASGRPSFVWATGSVAGLQGVPVEETARAHMKRLASLWGLSRDALATLELVEVHDTGRGGILARFRQRIDGVDVTGSDVRVLMRRNRDLVAVSGTPSAAATKKGKPGTRAFPLAPEHAAIIGLNDLFGLKLTDASLTAQKDLDAGGYVRLDLSASGAPTSHGLAFSEPARVKRTFVAQGDALVPAYFVELYAGSANSTSAEYYRYHVAAKDGRILSRQDLTSDAGFRVWADASGDHRPSDNPRADYTPHPAGVPDGSKPPLVAPVIVDLNGFNSPGGGPADTWLPPGAIATVGNNVDAYTDHGFPDGYSNGDQRAVVNGPDLFDYSFDFGQEPLASQSQEMAATAQLFYTTNWLHDYFYDSGFDEVSGNGQGFNFGRGGLGGDVLRAEAQDSALDNTEIPGAPPQFDNANMATPADGVSPRMQMFLWHSAEDLEVRQQPGGPAFVSFGMLFGAQSYDLTSNLVLVDDGAGTPTDGCQPPVNNVAGAVVLVDRGSCSFAQKAVSAELAGAAAVIVANNVPGAPPFAGGAVAGFDPTIPMVMVSFEDGVALKGALGSGPVSMHLRRTPQPLLDGSLDNSIVSHEWGHYLHHRLTFSGSPTTGAESEGWADFVALHTALREGDDLSGTYGMGTYAPQALGDTPYFGIRRFPYSVDPSKNALTLRHISDGEPLPAVPTGIYGTNGPNSEVHNAGEVWASMMFDSYVSMLQASEGPNPPYDFAEARRRMADYVVLGMKMTPRDATYTEARDAIIAAALASDSGDAQRIAEAFAVRGAGSCAVAPPRYSTDFVGVTESFELAPNAEITDVRVDDSVAPCDADGTLDAQETGIVTIDLKNSGMVALSGATVTVSTATAGVFFPNGNSVTVPDVGPLGATTAQFEIALDGSFTDVGELALNVSVSAPAACNGGVSRASSQRVNVDLVDQVSATETVENPGAAWTKTGAIGADVWSVEGTSAVDHEWHGADAGLQSDTALESPDLVVSANTPLVVSFTHTFQFEADLANSVFFDGGVLELSTDGGATWSDVSTWVDPGYSATIFNGSGNVLADRPAYAATNASFPAADTVTLDFGSTLAGQTVKLRFRIGTDFGAGAAGWSIDDIAVSGIDNQPFGAAVPHAGLCQAAPIAVAGPDQTAEIKTQIILDGSASSDPEGQPITIAWSQLSGNPVDIFPGLDGLATFVTPEVTEDVSLTFVVTVDDGVSSSQDTMNVLVQAPAEPPATGGAGSGGESAAGGSGNGGEPASGGAGGGDGGETDEDDGCGCRVVGVESRSGGEGGFAWLVAGLGAAVARLCRRAER